jgi:hypothetical protein
MGPVIEHGKPCFELMKARHETCAIRVNRAHHLSRNVVKRSRFVTQASHFSVKDGFDGKIPDARRRFAHSERRPWLEKSEAI